MAKLRLVHWNAGEAKPRLAALRQAGHTVTHDAQIVAGTMTRWKAELPDAWLIDLSRLPSHGREVAIAFRGAKATRHIPLIFVEGDLAKVAALRELLPDATYTTWPKLEAALQRALAKRIATATSQSKAGRSSPLANAAEPIVPQPMMDRYAGRTLAQKLGIREAMSVSLVDAPRDWASFLQPLPQG